MTAGLLCLRSLMDSAGARFSLAIHEDGSLDADDIARLESEIPRARVVTKASVEPMLAEKLKNYPGSAKTQRDVSQNVRYRAFGGANAAKSPALHRFGHLVFPAARRFFR